MKINKLLLGTLIIGIGTLLFLITKIDSTKVIKQEASANTTQTLAVGNVAPGFTLTTLDQKTFNFNDQKDKTVIVFGLAGWCGECVAEGKALTQIKNEYSNKGVEIIGVAFTKGDNNEFLKQYKQLGGIDIPLALDTDHVADNYHITKLETTYIINKEGKITYTDERFTSYEEYKKELDKII